MRKVLWVSYLLVLVGIICVASRVVAQETIISKKDADFVFGLTKTQWETASKKFFAPGWVIKSVTLIRQPPQKKPRRAAYSARGECEAGDQGSLGIRRRGFSDDLRSKIGPRGTLQRRK
jgi:hypothetical protein